MYNSNLLFVQDFSSCEGNLLSIKELENRIDKKIPFTIYFGLRAAIPQRWRDNMQNNVRTQTLSKPTLIEWITKDKKRWPKPEKNLGTQTR